MIKAAEARIELLKNPSFERKVELYKEVTDLINKAVSEGKKSFEVTLEQHYALSKELSEKGYTVSPFNVWFTDTKLYQF